jgi:hypothetical protein
MPAQRQKHISQKVGMVFASPSAFAAFDSGAICVATAPAPKLAAEIFRNRLRDNLSVDIVSTFPLCAVRTATSRNGAVQ